MLYSDLIRQETEYTYSANVQFDIENDKKLARFIPNETTIELFREYFIDIIRANPNHHSRILYGSYGTGKSHFLTVLSLLLSKAFTDGVAFDTFLTRVNEYDPNLAQDINAFVKDETRKPFLIVPIVFDFEDFDRCIYFSLTKKLSSIGISVRFKTFYTQALEQLSRWKEDEESLNRLKSTCEKEKINLSDLEKSLTAFDSKAESVFNRLFNKMTFGVNFVCEVSNLTESLTQVTEAISSQYSGMVFIFDEFGRYIEDNIKKIKVRSVQDLAEYCDHGNGNNHIILVSHKEISLYTQRISKTLSNEWKKIEGRYKATPINDKQDQCLSLIKSVLIKEEKPWAAFKQKYNSELQAIYNEALDFHGFLIDVARHENPFEGGFPLHPISLYALDKLSKKVAQNERTFFTYLASREENSLYRFLTTHEDDAFSFVGIDEIYDYFELSIKSLQSDASYEWYKKLQTALSKNKSNSYDNTPEVRILKVIATIGVINDSSVLVANKKTITSVINLPKDIVANSIDALCEKKILKYSGSYDRYDFFDSSIYDVDKMIAEESVLVKDERVIKTLNEDFINFVLYPHQYNNEYKISRVFVPVFALPADLSRRNLGNPYGKYYDGLLVFVLGNEDTNTEQVVQDSANIDRSIVVLNTDTKALKDAVKQYIAICYLESQKAKYTAKDPSFEKELQYYKDEVCELVFRNIVSWKQTYDDTFVIVSDGAIDTTVTSYADLTALASKIMATVYSQTLIVNNELINKNVVSGSIASAKKNALREMLRGEAPNQYYGLSLLSPEYISVRSVLAKNGFITPEVPVATNVLTNGNTPQTALNNCLQNYIERAQNEEVEFEDLYAELKSAPYGLRDGYLSLLLANALLQYKKSLIISSHGSEQELTVELFEDIVKRPDDFSFTIASWTKKELDYLDALEQLFSDYVDPNNLSKNRLKAIYEAMFSHYKNASKFARTTQEYVTAETKAYRKLLEKSYSSYSDFVFKKLKAIGGSYEATLAAIKTIKLELESAINELCVDLAHSICTLFNYETNTSLALLLSKKYRNEWVAKRQKSFDYCTNAFLEFTSAVGESELDCNVIASLSKSLTGFELMYWNDSHKAEFLDKLKDIKDKLDSYEVKNSLGETETRMTLKTSDGQEKSVVFDRSDLSPLSQTIKNKINATFNNYGMSVTYDDKVQVLLSLIEDLMEGN